MWKARHGHNLEGVNSKELALAIDHRLVEYLQDVHLHGARSRVLPSTGRVKSKPHSSFLDHQMEGMEKTWAEYPPEKIERAIQNRKMALQKIIDAG